MLRQFLHARRIHRLVGATLVAMLASGAFASAQNIFDGATRAPNFFGLMLGMPTSAADSLATARKWSIVNASGARYAFTDEALGGIKVEIRETPRNAETMFASHTAVIERMIVSSEHLPVEEWARAHEWIASMEERLILKYGAPKSGHGAQKFSDMSTFIANPGRSTGNVIGKWKRDDVVVALMIWRTFDRVWGTIDYTRAE